VGICDNNSSRLELCNRRIMEELHGRTVPAYFDTQFDQMIEECRPDAVVVTSRDATHDKYVVAPCSSVVT